MKKICVLLLSQLILIGAADDETRFKKIAAPLEEDPTYDLICSGKLESDLVDEHKFDKSTPGRIRLLSYNKLFFEGGQLYTIGVKLSPSALKDLRSYSSLPISIKAAYSPVSGGQNVNDSFNRPFSYRSNSAEKLNSGALKRLGMNEEGVLLEMQVPSSSYLSSLEFRFGLSSSVVERIQVAKGTIDDFPAFSAINHAPCLLPNTEISKEDIYLTTTYNPANTYLVSDLIGATKAYDRGDQIYLSPQLIKDDFTPNNTKIDTYFDVVLQVSDRHNNTTKLTYHIKAVDREKPIIRKRNSKIRISYAAIDSEESILNLFEISDNYRVKRAEIRSFDWEKDRKTIATHTLTVFAEDFSGNEVSQQEEIEIFDDIPPVIDGPEEVNTGNSSVLSKEEILANFSASDEIDGSTNVEIIYDDYTKNYKKLGEYKVVVKSTDKSSNSSQKELRVVVRDTEGPVFMIYSGIIKAYVGEVVDLDQMITALMRQGQIPNKNYISKTILEGPVIEEAITEGEHNYKLLLVDNEGTNQIVDLKIQGIRKPTVKKRLSFWQRVKSFFQDLYQRIKHWFSKKI